MMFTKEQIQTSSDDERPAKISITYADGHTVDFLGEAAEAMYRWQLNGWKLENPEN